MLTGRNWMWWGPHQVVQNLVSDYLHHFEGCQGRHGVHEHVAVNADEVLGVQDAVLILAGSIDDFGQVILSLVSYRLAKCVLDRRVITVHKMSIDELDS